MVRFSTLAFALVTVSLMGACFSAGGDDDSGGGGSSGTAGTAGSPRGGSAGSASGGTGGQSRGGTGGDVNEGGAPGGGTDTGGSSSGGSTTAGSGGTASSCVTENMPLTDLTDTDFTICDFPLPAGVEDFNVFIGSSLGRGSKLCWRGSDQGCDQPGTAPGGWWINGDQILLCDSSCSAYFDPEPDMVVYIEIGCPSDTCL